MAVVSPKGYPVKKVLENVATLKWGRDGECTFIASLFKILEFLGESTSYSEIMGISRAAFRLNFHEDWCPSSPDWFKRVDAINFLGYSLNEHFLKNEESKDSEDIRFKTKNELLSIIKSEINDNQPILAINLVNVADWGVITGYDNDSIICRSYYDKNEEYSTAQKFPWIVTTLKKSRQITDKNDMIIKSLQEAGENFFVEKWDGQYNGLAAYDKWIRDLQNESLFSEVDEKMFNHRWHVNAWVYNSHIDARHSARKFLEDNLEIFNPDQKKTINEIIDSYKAIDKKLYDNWIYFPYIFWIKENNKIWFPGDRLIEGSTWTKEMRISGAKILEEIKIHEKQIFEKLKSL